MIYRTDSEVEIDEVVGWELNMEQSKVFRKYTITQTSFLISIGKTHSSLMVRGGLVVKPRGGTFGARTILFFLVVVVHPPKKLK